MARNLPVSKEVVKLVFTLRNDNNWTLSQIGAHFRKSKQWAAYVLASYSAESLSPIVVQKLGRKRKTDEVEDGVICSYYSRDGQTLSYLFPSRFCYLLLLIYRNSELLR